MTNIDAHCHASDRWYEPVATLLFQMDRCGVGGAVLTQMIGQFDNSYQQACVATHSDRFASVVLVDPKSAHASDELAQLVDAGASGVRIGAAVDNDALWLAASALGLAVSVSGNAAQMIAPGFTARIASCPNAAFVLEHLGGIARPDFDGSDETRAAVMALARFPHVSHKITGLGQIGKRMALANDPPIEPVAAERLLEAVAHFGAARLMWGSDFPPVASREGYGHALGWPQRALAHLPDDQSAAIFGGNAARVFKLKA